ncbi:hypothetical protein [Streptosporangium sp. NPDC002721]|uniref:hypothetical protein n=1 Tax=Streptosporangium sp. NPDC002721 TaxID=3366188 RepID=UPI0036BF15A4
MIDNLTRPALTSSSADYYRGEIGRLDAEKQRLGDVRADLLKKIDDFRADVVSLDVVLGDLDDTADRYRERLAAAPVSLLPAPLGDTQVWPDGNLCPTCQLPMEWDPKQNAYVHRLAGGGFELAGNSCRRTPATGGDAVGGAS